MDDIFYDRSGNTKIKPANKQTQQRLSVYGLLFKEGKILLIHPIHTDHWELPGGGVENDDEISALEREILEETGYSVLKVGEMIHIRKQNFYADDKNIYYDSTQKFYLIDEYIKSSEATLDATEIADRKWFTIGDQANDAIRKNQLEVMQKIKSK